METQITGSIRTTSSSSNKLKMCLNFRPGIAEQLNMTERRFVQISREHGTTKYRLHFHEKNDGRCRPVQIKRGTGGAIVYVDQHVFELAVNEQRTATPISVEIEDNTISFEFDPEAFLKADPTNTRTLSKLESEEAKVEAGFDPDTSWGVVYRETADAEIKNIITEYFKFKAEVMNDISK